MHGPLRAGSQRPRSVQSFPSIHTLIRDWGRRLNPVEIAHARGGCGPPILNARSVFLQRLVGDFGDRLQEIGEHGTLAVEDVDFGGHARHQRQGAVRRLKR